MEAFEESGMWTRQQGLENKRKRTGTNEIDKGE